MKGEGGAVVRHKAKTLQSSFFFSLFFHSFFSTAGLSGTDLQREIETV